MKNLSKTLVGLLLCLILVANMTSGLGLIVKAAASGTPDSNTAVTVGDINGDGEINAKDVTMLRRHLAGGWGVIVNEEDADINGDGEINAKDVTMLRRYLAGGWDVELRAKAVDPAPLAVMMSSLDKIKVIFDASVNASAYGRITAYYMAEGIKQPLNVARTAIDSVNVNEVIVMLDSLMPQGVEVFVEYDGKDVGSFMSVTVDENSVKAIIIPTQYVTAGRETVLSYSLLDENGIDITAMLGDKLLGTISSEIESTDFDTYIISGNTPRIYCSTPNKTYTIKVGYTWYDKNGVIKSVEGRGVVTVVPEEPWQINGVRGVITHDTDADFVTPDHRNYMDIKPLDPLTLDTSDAVLQVAIPYYRNGETIIDSLGYSSELNMASYPDTKKYIGYELKSANESIVMLDRNGDRARLLLNKAGSTAIIVYGVMSDYQMVVIGAIQVQVFPVPNPLLSELTEKYVYNNTKNAEMTITTADAESLIKDDGSINTLLKNAECTMDAPEANVIQVAVPCTNIDGTKYDGLDGSLNVVDFTEYIIKSSDENVIAIGELNGGKLKFTCKNNGKSILSLYGRTSEGKEQLIIQKEIVVKRSSTTAPIVKEVYQTALDSVNVVFDRNVEEENLAVHDFDIFYYIVPGVKVNDAPVVEITIEKETVLLRFASNFYQGREYNIDFNGKDVGSFKAVTVKDDSVFAIIVDKTQIVTGQVTPISYKLLDANGVDITSALGETLAGYLTFEIKYPGSNPFAYIEGDKILIGEDDKACLVKVTYNWIDNNGIMYQVTDEAKYFTGIESDVPEGGNESEPEQKEWPVEPVPARMDVFVNKSVQGFGAGTINTAYEQDNLDIDVRILDQYGNEIKGLPVSVESIQPGTVTYDGPSIVFTGDTFRLNASDVLGEGTLRLKMVYNAGSDELARIAVIEVGCESEAKRYRPAINRTLLDTTGITEPTGNGVSLWLEGVTIHGFRTAGAPVKFSETAPKAEKYSPELGDKTEFPKRVFTVARDGRLVELSDLPTFDPASNTFYDAVKLENGDIVKMTPGTYVLSVYELGLNVGETTVVPIMYGVVTFTVK